MAAYKKKIENCVLDNLELVICPQFPYLPIMYSRKYELGAQNVSEKAFGSFTGEVSAECLKSLGTKYVIIGHYERELYFLENREEERKKIKLVLDNNMKAVIPVGESLMEYQLGKTMDIIIDKLSDLLKDVPEEKKKDIIIAYEPIWKVGKNLPLNKSETVSTINEIKQWLYKNGFIENPVIYGGGLSESDIKNLPEIDGFLLGTLSLDAEKLCGLFEIIQNSTHVDKS